MTRRPSCGLGAVEAIEQEMPIEQRARARSTCELLRGSAERSGDRVAIQLLKDGTAGGAPVARGPLGARAVRAEIVTSRPGGRPELASSPAATSAA